MNKNHKIILAVIFLIFTVLIGGKLIYTTYLISPEEKIDRYNFKQLEIIKSVLESPGNKGSKFFGIEEFNEKFQQNISTIKNCIYISSNNGNEDYIVGFQLESKKYKELYGTEYYSYPTYNIEPHFICDGISCDSDIKEKRYINLISSPCE